MTLQYQKLLVVGNVLLTWLPFNFRPSLISRKEKFLGNPIPYGLTEEVYANLLQSAL